MCFSLGWFENLLIWLVIIGAVVSLLKLLLIPYILAPLGNPGAIIIKALDIIVWAIVAIAIIVFIFDLISCLLGGGGSFRFVR